MKILQVVNSFKYAWSAGGAARVAYDLSLGLTKNGHSVMVFTTDKGLDSTHLKKNQSILLDGMEVYYFKNLSRFLANKGLAIPYYSPFIIKNKIKNSEIIHIHELRRVINIIIYYYAKKYKIPYVIHAHGAVHPNKKPLKRLLGIIFDTVFTRRFINSASKVIALNNDEAEEYEIFGLNKEKIVIVPNGIDSSLYINLPQRGIFKRKLGINNNTKIILYLGRIAETKGIDLLIEAFAHLIKKADFSTQLIIAGPDSGYLVKAKFISKSLHLTNLVNFTGFLSPVDKLNVLVDADVFVTPSFYGFPMTFLEACAVGTPIVTTTLGDRLDWIDRNVGLVTQPTVHDLSQAIYAILNDCSMHKKLSQRCIRYVNNEFSIQKVVKMLEKIYISAIKQKAIS